MCFQALGATGMVSSGNLRLAWDLALFFLFTELYVKEAIRLVLSCINAPSCCVWSWPHPGQGTWHQLAVCGCVDLQLCGHGLQALSFQVLWVPPGAEGPSAGRSYRCQLASFQGGASSSFSPGRPGLYSGVRSQSGPKVEK